jgi:hypothetical protein
VHFHYIIYLSANQPIQEVTMPVLTIKFTALIPTVDYGNIGGEITQEIEVPADIGIDQSAFIANAYTSLRLSHAMSVLPLVEAEVTRLADHLMKLPKQDNPDYYMRKNCKVYNWFVISNPDVRIPAMERILEEKEAGRKPDMKQIYGDAPDIRRNIPQRTGWSQDQMEDHVDMDGHTGSWKDMDKASKK